MKSSVRVNSLTIVRGGNFSNEMLHLANLKQQKPQHCSESFDSPNPWRFLNLFRSTMEQFHKSPATYTIHLGNLTACLPEYTRHRRSITIFMCAQKGHNIIFKNQIEKMECFGVGGMKFPAFCLPSIDCSRLCQAWFLSKEFDEGCWGWHCLDQPSTTHSLSVAAVFPAISADPGCLPGPKDATTSNSLINLEGEMICLSPWAESPRERLWGFTSKAAEKRAKMGSLTFPSPPPPGSAHSLLWKSFSSPREQN